MLYYQLDGDEWPKEKEPKEIGAKMSRREGLEYEDFLNNLVKGFTSWSIPPIWGIGIDF